MFAVSIRCKNGNSFKYNEGKPETTIGTIRQFCADYLQIDRESIVLTFMMRPRKDEETLGEMAYNPTKILFLRTNDIKKLGDEAPSPPRVEKIPEPAPNPDNKPQLPPLNPPNVIPNRVEEPPPKPQNPPPKPQNPPLPMEQQLEQDLHQPIPVMPDKPEIDMPSPVSTPEIGPNINVDSGDYDDMIMTLKAACNHTETEVKEAIKRAWGVGEIAQQLLESEETRSTAETVIRIRDTVAADPSYTSRIIESLSIGSPEKRDEIKDAIYHILLTFNMDPFDYGLGSYSEVEMGKLMVLEQIRTINGKDKTVLSMIKSNLQISFEDVAQIYLLLDRDIDKTIQYFQQKTQ